MDYKLIWDNIRENLVNIKNPPFLQDLNKQKINYILGVVGLVVLLDIFFILLPQFSAITKKYLPERKKLIQQLRDFERSSKANPDTQAKLQQMETNFQETLSKLANEENIPEFLSWVSTLAKDNRVKLMEIQPMKETEPTGKTPVAAVQEKYYPLPIQLHLEAGYHELGSFLNGLEEGKYFARITNLEIKANPQSSVVHDINLRLEIFVLKE